MSDEFNISLPEPYSGNWRSALRNSNGSEETPRRTSYQPPGGEPEAFNLVKTNVSGGQSNDISEYSAFGGWSNKPLNYLPQKIKISGRLLGTNYIQYRNKLAAAFSVETSDDEPAYLILPFWGRFAVNMDTWDISEETSAQGGCEITLAVDRVGQSAGARQENNTSGNLDDAIADLEDAAVARFESVLDDDNLSVSALETGFSAIKDKLLNIIGRLQLAQNTMNSLTNEALNIISLIEQGITAPGDFARALFSCITAITATLISDVSAVEDFFSSDETTSSGNGDSIYNATLQFISAKSETMNELSPSTFKESATKQAMVALYRHAAFVGAATTLPNVDTISADQIKALYSLFMDLEDSLNVDDPNIYKAVTESRIAVMEQLQEKETWNERSVQLQGGLPMLVVAQLLGCDYDKVEELNSDIDDQLMITGGIFYV
ncbi:hypothetical protein [Sediminispirochaeta bajacaliforniensis]|uniref:hypothetical protein n=1 Tax=Sediminispirochaeta bajacaliforniensis TaxID=148 RepID=UPI0003745DB9|nr:hypothetical protein [Sediminispirochaeta bajacaliforniensis]